MAYDYSKFDEQIDIQGLKEDVNDIENGNGKRNNDDEVPVGVYEVKVVKLELVPSKKSGDPMVSAWFEILNGDYEGRYLFMNQTVTTGMGIHEANKFIRSLDSGKEVVFDTYKQYGQLLLDIHEAIDGKLEYIIGYTLNKKGYKVFTIKEIFEVGLAEDDIPS